jgi:ABC-type oligopeptide transport system substrate-binding subunit
MLGYKPELARELLAAAGVSPADFADVTWLHTHGIADPVIIEVLTDSWQRALGVNLRPQVLRWKDYQSRLDAGVPDVIIGTWTADFSDPDNFLRAVFHSGTGLNEPKWHSTEFDMLVDSAASRTDQAGRMNFYRAADRTLCVEEAAIVPLCYGREPVLVKSSVASFPQTASWLRHLKNCYVRKVTPWSGGSN